MTSPAIARIVAATCAQQGVPERVTDQATLQRLAVLFKPDDDTSSTHAQTATNARAAA